MALQVTEEWLRAYCARTGIALPEIPTEKRRRSLERGEDSIPDGMPTASPPRRNKYGNVKTETDGITFDSRHEAEVYARMRLETAAGEHLALLRQVPFSLPGGVKYIADFVTLDSGGGFTVYDAKSPATRKDKVYRLKKRQMRSCLGIDILEV